MSYEKTRSESIVTIVLHLSLTLFLIIASITGWVSNIIAIFNLDTFSGEMVLRAVGIVVAPLGAILGFF